MHHPSPTSDPVETYGIDPAIFHRRKQIHAVLCISLVIIVMAVSSLNVAIPSIAENVRASSTQILWIIEAYALVFAGTLLPAGALGDRFGRKTTLLIGLAIFASMSFVAGLASGATQLIAARAVMGIGAALIMPSTLSIITNVFPPHERAKAIAAWAGFAGAGGALGPLLTGLILRALGREHWGAVFFVNIPLTVLLIVLVVRLVPQSKDPTGHALDPVGSLLSVIALGSAVFGIIEAPHWGWASPAVLACFAVALLAGFAFIRYELRQEHPTIDPRLFRVRGFSMGTLTISIAFFCMFGMYLLLAQYFQFGQGHTPLDGAVRTLPAAATMVIIAPRSPRIAAALGMKNLIRLGMTLTAAGLVGIATLGLDSPYWRVLVSLVVLASGMAMTMAPTSATIVNSLPLSKAGVGSAVNDVSREVGGAIGIAVLGSLLTSGYQPKMAARIAANGAPIPGPVRHAIEDSIQGAFAAADRLPAAHLAMAEPLRQAARQAFSHAYHLPILVAAGVALVGMIVISHFIPNHPPTGQTIGQGPGS